MSHPSAHPTDVRAVTLPSGVRQLLTRPEPVVLSTVNPDGSPQSSVMWVAVDGDDLLMTTKRHRRKLRNIELDPRVSVTVFDSERIDRYAEIRGVAQIIDTGGLDLVLDLAELYTGSRSHVGDDDRDDLRVVLRIAPHTVFYRP